jgi:aerobic-type carbon monoxide dehydrogenase small subunit (CoxS/CutS family)
MPRVTQLHVNGKQVSCNAEGERSLLSVLRDDLGLTGSKYGCGEGECGACTVLLNGQPRRSCLTKVGEVGEREVTTIESLERDGKLHPLQQAFIDADAMQCAYCTSGMLMSALGLLKKNPSPGRAEIIRGMQGNICRCGTYPRIVVAIGKAAEAMRGAAR